MKNPKKYNLWIFSFITNTGKTLSPIRIFNHFIRFKLIIISIKLILIRFKVINISIKLKIICFMLKNISIKLIYMNIKLIKYSFRLNNQKSLPNGRPFLNINEYSSMNEITKRYILV